MQNLREFVDAVSVPIKYDTVAFWIVRLQHDCGRKHEDYRVRRWVIIELLKWLPLLLPGAYSDVNWPTGKGIDTAHLESLPDDDSIFDLLPHETYKDDGETASAAGASSTGPMMSEYVSGAEIDMDSSGCPLRPPKVTNREAAHRAAEAAGGRATRIDWATASLDAESEWQAGYVVNAFPLRFTVETADLNDNDRMKGGQKESGSHHFKKVTPEEYFHSLQWYWDSFTHCYPFANDPRFKYLGHNLSTRRRTLNKATAFTRQLPAGTTREQVLWQLDNDNHFTINKLMVRAADIKGTALHVIAQRSKICNWVLNGLVEFSLLPNIFLTSSEAELHDPFLHRLLDKALPSQMDVDQGKVGAYHDQVCKYLGADPPPPDELRRRKLAVRDNLHLVTDFYVRKTRLLHHFVLEPMFDVDSFAARTEFAQRRTMSHTHELLRLRDRPISKQSPSGDADGPSLDPKSRPKVPSMQMCFDAMKDPTGIEARHIVAFAAWMGLSAIHPSQSRTDWPEDYGGAIPDSAVKSAGNASLRRTFTSLNSAADRTADEISLVNRCLCHACGPYCLRPVVSRRTGKPLLDADGKDKMACRFRPDEKEEHSCACPHCSADLYSRLEVVDECCACGPCDCECGTSDCGCKTIVWQLPLTFRFELRYSRNLGRLQVHVRPLTHAARVNYDIQFVMDYAAVIDYVRLCVLKSRPCRLCSSLTGVYRASADRQIHGEA